MKSTYRSLCLILLACCLAACGPITTIKVTRPAESSDTLKFRQATLAPVHVTTSDQDAESLALNSTWATLAESELKTMLQAKKIETTPDSGNLLVCKIHISYGNAALRYWVGGGAGAGTVAIWLELKDASDQVRFATFTDSTLKSGAGWGGDMKKVVASAIKEAVDDFSTRL